MKKSFIIFLAAIVILTSGILAKDQVFEKGTQAVTAALGLSSFGTPIEVNFELGLNENIGVGAAAMYQSWGYDLGEFGDYSQTLITPSVFALYRVNKWIKVPKLDLAAGAAGGFSIYSSSWDEEVATGGAFVALVITGRYYVSNKIAIYVKETVNLLGDWSGSYTLFGVTYKLK